MSRVVLRKLTDPIALRDPLNPEYFWINPLSTHFSQIRVSDLVLVNEQGEVQPEGAQAPSMVLPSQSTARSTRRDLT